MSIKIYDQSKREWVKIVSKQASDIIVTETDNFNNDNVEDCLIELALKLNNLILRVDDVYADNFVNTNRLRDRSVTNAKLANSSVSSEKIMNGAVTYEKMDITNLLIDGNSNILSNSIVNSSIKNATITGDKLANNTISADKILNGTITDAKLANSSVTNIKIADGSITEEKLKLSNLTLTGTLNASNVVMSAASITSLITDSVQTENLTSKNITSNNIIANKSLRVVNVSMQNDSSGTLVINNDGASGSNGDILFSKNNSNENVMVKIDGDLTIKNTISSDQHNIEMRSVANEGWGFFAK